MECTMTESLTLKEDENIFSKNKLIKLAIEGDKEAYTSLIIEYKEYLYKMAFLYVKNEDTALEVLHETVYRGFLCVHKLKNPSFFKTWLTRIVINVSLDILKKTTTLECLKDDTPIVNEKKILSIEERLDLYSAIDLLKENYKTVIIMMYFNDMKIKEISKVMEIPENTVKTYLNRAKKALGELLKEGYLNE